VTEKLLRIGDPVIWRGGWGSDPPKDATVTDITLADEERGKYGEEVKSMSWELVPIWACVSLDNGHWAYGYQLEPKED
jgi:hypothetical protein